MQQPQSPFLMDSDNGFKAFDTQRFLAVVKKLAENDRLFNAENLAQEFVKRGNQQNAREVTANLQRQTGVDLQGFLGNSPALLEKVNLLTTANTQLIKSISSQYLDKVQTAVTQSVMTGKLNADLAKEIRQIGNVTESRARLIARDQSSKLNATLTQVRHQDVGIKKYRWSTSGDERVRTSHAENDGKIFSYDDPPATGHPGHEINCRCVQIPVLDEKAERENKQVGKWDMLSPMEQQQVLEKSPSIADSTKGLMAGLKERKVEVKPVQLLKKQLSGSEIIQKLAGGDETKGSCASLALAYIGNRLGLDVTDYRDGESRSFFSNALNFRKLVTTQGVKSAVFEVVREAKDVATLLEKELVLGKEYILGAGKHAAIVRKTENGLEYLEMQSRDNNGWKSFRSRGTVARTLYERFGCQLSPNKYGLKSRVELAEVGSFKSVKADMRAILGYINTATNKQKKGSTGYAK